jgi:hypothetical protein
MPQSIEKLSRTIEGAKRRVARLAAQQYKPHPKGTTPVEMRRRIRAWAKSYNEALEALGRAQNARYRAEMPGFLAALEKAREAEEEETGKQVPGGIRSQTTRYGLVHPKTRAVF